MRFLNIVKILFLLIILSFHLHGCAVVNVAATSPAEMSGELAVHFIDVGQGDSAFVQLSNGENILIDTGSPSGGHTVAAYLKKLGVSKIDHLMFTHPHDDHIGGIFSVLSSFEVRNFYDNGISNFSSTIYGEYLASVRKDLSKYHIVQAGETLRAGDVEIHVLNPLLPPAEHINNDSIVLRLTHGDITILLAGDMGKQGERRLMRAGADLSAGIIKIGHHGEMDVCSDEFLKAVMPESAVISAGRNNKYARPHPELLQRLSSAGIKIYRTDRDGHITLRSDGKTYSIETER